MKIPLRIRVALGLVFVCIVWGSTWLIIKESLSTVPPFLAAGLRFVIAIIILQLMMMAQGIKVPNERRFWLLSVQLSMVTYAMPFALIYWGGRQIPSGLSAVLFATFPFWVAVFSRFRIKTEKLAPFLILGIVSAFVGVVAILSRQINVSDRLPLFGMLSVLASAGLQAFGLISLIKNGRDYSPTTINFVGMLIAGIILLSTSAFVEDYSKLQFGSEAIVPLLYLSVFATVLTYVTYFWLTKYIAPVILSLTAFVTPIIAVSLGIIAKGEQFDRNVILGAVLVLSGILLANIAEILRKVRGVDPTATAEIKP
jgi:drug/metabolite transporter (DMT)-like permease